MKEENKLYNVDELCEILRVHFHTIRKLLISKELKGFKVGREWRVTQKDLEEYIENGKQHE